MMRMTRQAVSETSNAIDVAWFNVAVFLKLDPESNSESGGSGLYIGLRSRLQRSLSEQQLMFAGLR